MSYERMGCSCVGAGPRHALAAPGHQSAEVPFLQLVLRQQAVQASTAGAVGARIEWCLELAVALRKEKARTKSWVFSGYGSVVGMGAMHISSHLACTAFLRRPAEGATWGRRRRCVTPGTLPGRQDSDNCSWRVQKWGGGVLPNLRRDARNYCYRDVRRWTLTKRLRSWGQASERITDCDRIIIPVHLGMHWTCAIIDMRAKRVVYLDSLGVRRPALPSTLRGQEDSLRDPCGCPAPINLLNSLVSLGHPALARIFFFCGAAAGPSPDVCCHTFLRDASSCVAVECVFMRAHGQGSPECPAIACHTFLACRGQRAPAALVSPTGAGAGRSVGSLAVAHNALAGLGGGQGC
jgi:Ulp1 protease family, C-terminal catalytic domain